MEKKSNNTIAEKKEKQIRYFRCFYNDGAEFGRYSGKTPKQAANKAFSSIIKLNGGNDEFVGNKYRFIIRECTRNYKPKEKEYEGTRIKLTNPIKVKIGGTKEINYQYLNKVKYIAK